jgi:hypothetical protein
MEIKEMLDRALMEINELRRRNEILSVKVETFEQCVSMVHAEPPRRMGGAVHPDIAWEIQKHLSEAAKAAAEQPKKVGR